MPELFVYTSMSDGRRGGVTPGNTSLEDLQKMENVYFSFCMGYMDVSNLTGRKGNISDFVFALVSEAKRKI